jgi:hypothetical protein
VKGIGAAGRLKLSIGGYGSRLKAGTTAFITAVIVRLDRTIQYAAASRFIIGVSGILDHPPEPVIGRPFAPTRWRAMASESVARSLSRHCERSEAIHLAARRGERWIASSQVLLAMTERQASAIPRRDCARTMQETLCPSITEGAGKAGCPVHPQPRVQSRKHTSVVTTGSPEHSGLPCAMVLRLTSCSPR